MFRPHCIQGTQNCCWSNHISLRLAFLSCILFFHRTHQACRPYSSFFISFKGFETQHSVIGFGPMLCFGLPWFLQQNTSSDQACPHSLQVEMSLWQHLWQEICRGITHLANSCWGQEMNNSIKWKGSTSAVMGAVRSHVVPLYLYSHGLKIKCLLPAAQRHFLATTAEVKSVGELPISERWLPPLPVVFRGSCEPSSSLLGCFYLRRMAGKRCRLLTPSFLICWSWILFCSEVLMVSASRESVYDTPSLLFILVWSQLSYF